ncbi:MAG: non-hydrolyzing UDP-N-acetylglucosamine 2-epimerase [Pseudobacter sp.]|uniref:non-hydrolyzing UDP-N-acetylglucosamine 2-epimerase n=1 Tax=Pseudobacter sp. TaxID=2045420 RepID=UPI003F7EA131
MKISVVYGTRPEIIKLVPLILQMQQNPAIELVLISTGQHREMVEEIEGYFNIRPHYNLNIMQHNQSLTDIMLNVTAKIDPVLKEEKPDVVLVQGDTSTVATVGTVCFYNKIPVGHIEAGLRSYNLEEPFPEEFNRRLISIFARYNFAPTAQAAQNLLREGVSPDRVFVTGNTIVDMVQLVKKKGMVNSTPARRKVLITAHRRENYGAGILNICTAVKRMAAEYPELDFVWPVHPNPNVKEVVYRELGDLPQLTLTPPMNYFELINQLNDAYLVWSDSGGIQEECPSFKKPVLILRNVTERPEVVENGFGELVGTEVDRIVSRSVQLLEDDAAYLAMTSGANPFGDGTTSQQIIDLLLQN